MFASPADYAYDKLAWSFIVPQTDSLVNAEDALRALYGNLFAGKYHAITTPNIVMPVDSAAVYSHYGLDTANVFHAQYLIPYMRDITTNLGRLGKQGMSLGNTLSVDIIANSVKSGFERPVFIASTVPSSYYLGLTPFMSSTGMAMEVTPFATPVVSPTAEKAYENIMGKFRWGGLDTDKPQDLYLDETVRRMVASTRSGIYSTARDLILSADVPATAFAVENAAKNGFAAPADHADMARILLVTLEDKLPAAASPFDGMLAIYMAESYYDLYLHSHDKADLDAARRLLALDMPRYAQLIRYAQSLSSSQVSLLGASELNALQHLGAAIALQNRIDVLTALEQNPEANAELIAAWAARPSYDTNLRSAPLLYIDGWSEDDLVEALKDFSGNSAAIVQYAILTSKAHKAAGIEPMALSHKWMNDYGIDPSAWNRLIRI